MTRDSGKELTVIHLDDDPFELEKVEGELSKQTDDDPIFRVLSAGSVSEFEKILKENPNPEIILLDVDLGGSEKGDHLASSIRSRFEHTVILMRSGFGDFKTVKRCLNSGADDFISKDMAKDELRLRLSQSYELAKVKRGNPALAVDNFKQSKAKIDHPIIGTTMSQMNARVPRVIDSALAAVHICGESGTGKEVVADLFAAHLPSETPFIKVNCGAISQSLLESELFGHVKGAFTGAAADKKGMIEAADGGWIFMDEVATLSSSAQIALLRVLENQEVRRVGSSKTKNVNVRFISATNESLESRVHEGTFRGDLWQRLCEAEFRLPPLRDRPQEIEALIEHFCQSMRGGPFRVSSPAMEVLCSYHWRNGNVRELRNCLRAMTELQVDKLLTPLAIPDRIWESLDETKPDHAGSMSEPPTKLGGGEMTLTWDSEQKPSYELMSDKLLLALTKYHSASSGKNSLRSLAKEMGMSRSTLSTRLKGLATKGVISFEELTAMVGIGE